MTYIHPRTEKVSPGTLQEVNKALERYVAELEADEPIGGVEAELREVCRLFRPVAT